MTDQELEAIIQEAYKRGWRAAMQSLQDTAAKLGEEIKVARETVRSIYK